MNAPRGDPPLCVTPARIEFDDDGTPRSVDYGDIYRPNGDALGQARRVFVAGNDLPARWHGRLGFTILETGFGLGHNLLAVLEAWHADPPSRRCAHLHVVSIEKHPAQRADLERAWSWADSPGGALHARTRHDLADLLTQWPPATPGMHRLGFADGAVTLDLVFADVLDALRELVCVADAIFLDGFAPTRNAAMWAPPVFRALARVAADDATAATWSVARTVRDGLQLAGFDVRRVDGSGEKRQVLTAHRRALPPGRARHDPLTRLGPPVFAQRAMTRTVAAPTPRPVEDVLVIGAGLAGAHAAAALARHGLRCIVVDRRAEPAQEASGGLAGIFHGTMHKADTLHARLHRAASLEAARRHRAVLARADGGVPGAVDGLLRLADIDLDAMRNLIDVQGLPAGWIAAVDAAAASRMAGVTIDRACWFFPHAGWIAPQALVRHLLGTPGITFHGSAAVARIERVGSAGDEHWHVIAADGATIARARACVLANADQAAVLAPWARWPLETSRGQSTCLPAGTRGLAAPRLPIGSKGYALTMNDGRVLCGASAHRGDAHDHPRASDTADNLAKLARLTGSRPDIDPASTIDRVGWRVRTVDRLPIAGAVPIATLPEPARQQAQPRHVAREPGLYVLTGLGSRGLTLAPLMAEVVAAAILRRPVPVEASILDAVDPARFILR